MLYTVCKYVKVRNISDKPNKIFDRLLPFGELLLNPNEEAVIPTTVYMKAFRYPWLQKVAELRSSSVEVPVDDNVTVEAEAEAEEPTTAKPRRRKGDSNES